MSSRRAAGREEERVETASGSGTRRNIIGSVSGAVQIATEIDMARASPLSWIGFGESRPGPQGRHHILVGDHSEAPDRNLKEVRV